MDLATAKLYIEAVMTDSAETTTPDVSAGIGEVALLDQPRESSMPDGAITGSKVFVEGGVYKCPTPSGGVFNAIPPRR